MTHEHTITGADLTRSLRAARARRTRHILEIADIRRRAAEARAGYTPFAAGKPAHPQRSGQGQQPSGGSTLNDSTNTNCSRI